MPINALVEAQALVKEYGAGRRVVENVSFSIERGEALGLVGESGSGKSTVARIIMQLIRPTAGELRYQGLDLLGMSTRKVGSMRRHMQIIFQDPYAALNPRMRVKEILAEPFSIHHQRPVEGLKTRLEIMLRNVGMDGSALERFPHEFSGGQRQRINIARALALKPEFLILDEPVSALDVSVAAQVVNLLRDLKREHGLTYLFISHSMPLVRYLCDRIAVMQAGRLVELGECEQICDTPQEEYTRRLVRATPRMP
jgi:ABC-type glutathione transport system ATPase component